METARDQVVIDTDILVDILRNVRKTVDFITELEKKEYLFSTTVVNVFELYYSAYKSRNRAKNLAATGELLKRLIILNMKFDSAKKAGQIHARLEAQGKSIGLRDAVIGAISLNEGYSVVTRNVEHLSQIKGLKLISAP
jgi:predicted nucleic acid-binding protein